MLFAGHFKLLSHSKINLLATRSAPRSCRPVSSPCSCFSAFPPPNQLEVVEVGLGRAEEEGGWRREREPEGLKWRGERWHLNSPSPTLLYPDPFRLSERRRGAGKMPQVASVAAQATVDSQLWCRHSPHTGTWLLVEWRFVIADDSGH